MGDGRRPRHGLYSIQQAALRREPRAGSTERSGRLKKYITLLLLLTLAVTVSVLAGCGDSAKTVEDQGRKITVGEQEDGENDKVTVEGEYWGPRISIRRSFVLVQDVPFHHVVEVEDLLEGEREHMLLLNDNRRLFEVDNRTWVIDFTPRNEHVGTWTVTFELWYYWYLQDTAAVTFEVVNRNDRPTLERMHMRLAREGEPVDVRLAFSEPDLEPRLLDNATPVDPWEALAFDTTLPHPASFETTGEMVWTPTREDAARGNVTAYFKVADRQGLGDSFCVTFVVLHVHKVYNLQVIGIVEGQRVDEGHRLFLRASAASTDPVEELTYLWYAGTTLIGQTQEIEWKVRGRGRVPVRLVVEDRYGTEAELTVNITVMSFSSPPDRLFIWTCLSTTIVVITLVVSAVAMWIGADRTDRRPHHDPHRR